MSAQGLKLFKKVMGRPRSYEKPEDMIPFIEEYFKEAKPGKYTITGLCLALGMSRQRLCVYGETDGFSDTVKMAKQLVENDYEISLRENGRAGEIFGLKNFGWKDKYDVENTGNITHNHQGIPADVGVLRGWREPVRETQSPPDTLPN